jgi:hypothetical protein
MQYRIFIINIIYAIFIMNMLSSLLCIGFVLCILFVVSGYQQSSLEEFSPARYPEAHTTLIKPKKKLIEKDCNPGFDCRRVGFYCSLID